jgi:hypothetical protein
MNQLFCISDEELAREMMTHESIVSVAAEAAKAHARELGRAGIVANLRLYYKREALRLQSVAVDHNLEAEGWIATDRYLSCALPYDRYWQWINDHSQDVPIYA